MKTDRKKINIDFPFDYKLIKRNGSKLVILLHGFAQSAQEISTELLESIPEGFDVLIPNGPFPIPKITPEKVIERYAWYFYNRHSNSYKIDYNFSASLISKLIDELDYKDTEKLIIGYSQGGYLSPFLAQELTNVSLVLGLCCTIKWQFLPEKLNFPLIQIHGKEDLMVDYKNSFEHYSIIKQRLPNSSYIVVEDEGHRLKDPFKREIEKILLNQ
ncbi:hypothetical protein [Halobacteriovorax sp. HLS]|uniref:hypothetical protein n=1 Tax=Halobacteriovorax sp. HLS TaxID=2234000 RepID=UPI0013E3C5F6|nr:hypothetical protein [Halobacteriovorax sp. HLS]